MDIRIEIRNILKEVFSEAAPTEHFDHRVYERLTSNKYTQPDFDYSKVIQQIEIVKNTNFNPKKSFAIFLNRFPVTYLSKDPDTGKISIGNEVWVVIRNNEITTVFFRKSSQKDVKVSGVDTILNIKTLFKNYIDSKKNSDGTVDFNPEPGEGTRKKSDLDFPIVEFQGKIWYVDQENEKVIFVKNTKKQLSFNDLDEDFLEKIIDAVTK